MAKNNKFKKITNFFYRKEVFLVFFLILSALFVYAISRMELNQVKNFIQLNYFKIILLFILAIIFSMIRSLSFKLALNSKKIDFTFLKSFKFFLMSMLIEVTVFPSKVASDIFKFYYLKKYSWKPKLQAILLFRIGIMFGFLIPVLILLFLKNTLWGVLVLLIIILVVFFYTIFSKYNKFKKYLEIIKNNTFTLLKISLLNMGSLIIDVLRISILASLFGIGFSIDFMLVYFVAIVLGVISNLPIGIGVKEISLGTYLSTLIGVDQVIIFLVLFRLTGELFSGFLGWVLFGKESLDKLRVVRKKIEKDKKI